MLTTNGGDMKNSAFGVILGLLLLVAVALPVLAGEVQPHRYFGRGPGYLDPARDFMSYGDPGAKYFRSSYPESRWGKYGYGTGHLGQGYGPYIFGGRSTSKLVEDRPDHGMPMLRPSLNWIGGNEVRVTAPWSPSQVKTLHVEVVNFVGAVLETGTVSDPPYEIIARLPEGATQIRVSTELSDGLSAASFSIEER
jgi:hypothetical protein